MLKYVICFVLSIVLLVSCNNEELGKNNTSVNLDQVKKDLELNKFSNVNIAENVAVNWESTKETEKSNFKITEITAYEKSISTLESDFLQNHLKYQIVAIESEGQLYSYFVEAYSNKESTIYPETITKLNDFTGTLNVFLLNGENLGSVAIYKGKARNISENNNLNVLTASINAFMTNPDTTNKMPQCGGNYTVIIDQTISRFDVWTVGDRIVAVNYVGTTTTRTSSIMPFPCDGVYDKEDILNQRLESYNYKDGSGGIPTSANYFFPPSCESFNFTSKKGANWQEAAVKNITLRIVVLTQNRVEVTNTMIFPQAVLFGMPINYNKGNGDVTAGAAATVSAMVLNETMKEMAKLYTRTLTNELTLRTQFQELLINNYRIYTNGGTVNFNSTSSLPATNYKTNPRETGLCDN